MPKSPQSVEVAYVLKTAGPALTERDRIANGVRERVAALDPDPIRAEIEALSSSEATGGDPLAALDAKLRTDKHNERREQLQDELYAISRRREVLREEGDRLYQQQQARAHGEVGAAWRTAIAPRIERIADLLHDALDEAQALFALERECSAAAGVGIDTPGLAQILQKLPIAIHGVETATGRFGRRSDDLADVYRLREKMGRETRRTA